MGASGGSITSMCRYDGSDSGLLILVDWKEAGAVQLIESGERFGIEVFASPLYHKHAEYKWCAFLDVWKRLLGGEGSAERLYSIRISAEREKAFCLDKVGQSEFNGCGVVPKETVEKIDRRPVFTGLL